MVPIEFLRLTGDQRPDAGADRSVTELLRELPVETNKPSIIRRIA